MKIKIGENEFGGQSSVKAWYRLRWPSDDLGEAMNGGVTFQEVFEALQVGVNIYALLGVNDSIIRERVFDALATMMNCSYDHVYYQWLDAGTDKMPLYDDLEGLRFKKYMKE